MQIPAEFTCCVCLSVPEVALKADCSHKLCQNCARQGCLTACPVCRKDLVAEDIDADFTAQVARCKLHCQACGEDIPLLQAESHCCGPPRKSPRHDREEGLDGPLRAPRAPPPNRSTFKCPWCEEVNLSPQALLEHCKAKHQGPRGPTSAVCPICAAMPWGDPNYVSRNFISHLELRHRCDYAVLTDFDVDEEAMLRRALEESAREAGEDCYEAELQRILEESAREMTANVLPPDNLLRP